MRINKGGVTRIVFIFERVVVKIPKFTSSWDHFLRGLIGNISEGQTWRWNSGKFENGSSHLLCPVLWTSWGGWILVMKRADSLPQMLNWGTKESTLIDEHLEYFAGDDTVSNYGLLNGKIVKIDYADLDNHWGEDFKKQ